MREGLGRATHPLGGLAGAHRRVEGHGTVAGGEGVAREVGGRAEVGVLEQCLGAGPVQLEPLGGQQVVGHGLGEQRVPELVAVLAAGLEDVVLDGGAQRGAQRRGVDPGDALEQVVRARDGR